MGSRVLVVDDSPTIRKVVSAILSRAAYEPLQASDGVTALLTLGREPVDLILLDFVMPRMNGYQFCRELRSTAKLKHLPVVLMSAKSDKIRGRFVQQTGAVDAITKPFDARALIAVVEGALSKQQEGRMRRVPDAAEMPDEEDPGSESQAPPADRAELGKLREARAPQQFAAALAELVTPGLQAAKLEAQVVARVTEGLERAFTPQTLDDLLSLLQSLAPDSGAQSALSGDLAVFSLAELLQMLEMQRRSGTLRVWRKSSSVTLFVRQGAIDFAVSQGLRGEFLLGRFLVEDGVISREELEAVLAEPAGRGLSGQHLLGLGLVNEKQLQDALMRQTTELVYEVVRWKSGHFALSREPPAEDAEHPCFKLAISGLVMEGFRRVDEWRLIEGSIDFDEVLHRDEIAIARVSDASKLTKQERDVLDKIDGERTVRELVEASEGSSFVVCKILYQLLNSRLVGRSAA